MTEPHTEIGPIDYLIVEFPDDDRRAGDGLPMLVDLVDRGLIRLLDMVFVRRDQDGSVVGVALSDFDDDSDLDLTVFESAASGTLVGDDELGQAGAVLRPGSSAAILIYENLSAAPLASTLRRGGGELVASGRIPHSVVRSVLDELKS